MTVDGEDIGNRSLPEVILKELANPVQKCTELQGQFSKPASKEKVSGRLTVTLLMDFTYRYRFKSYINLRPIITDAAKVCGDGTSG